MKYIKKFESYKENPIVETLKNIHVDDVTLDMVSVFLEYQGISAEKIWDEEEVEEHLIKHITAIKKSNNPITLYRIVSADNLENVDENNLGIHYTLDDMYIDEHFLMDIGIDDEQDLFIFKVEVDKKYIDVINTLKTNIEWITENEVALYPNTKVKVLDKYKKFDEEEPDDEDDDDDN